MKYTTNGIPFFPEAELNIMSEKEINKLYKVIANDIVETDTTYTFHVGDNAFTLEIQKVIGGVRVSLFRNYNMNLSDYIGSQLFRLKDSDDMISPEQLLLRSVYAIKHGYLGSQAIQVVS